uniref:NADH dehydrogenase subunit 6 n=1 Tax=Capsala katsuwoni TaxID=2904576 RepID=A0A8T9JDD6_9PLAT|nr:NADH dehydrogenase subunit 6 [Capsala katsuwoni]UOK11868.1 NADH dehydrogenase subunit 6 [Capsala katsuwoni]
MLLSLSFYFFFLSLFSFVSNSIGYCVLLVLSSLCVSISCYLYSGYAWYAFILYLVYVGGVYILFIFLSIHVPNTQNAHNLNYISFWFLFWICFECCYSMLSFLPSSSNINFSFYLCGGFSGLSYLLVCSFLILGFMMVSFVSSTKDGFVR